MNTLFLRSLTVLLCCFLVPLLLHAQDFDKIKISASYQEESLELVLLDLKINHRLKFEYQESDIEQITITQYFRKKPLPEAMKLLLLNTGLAFTLKAPRTVQLLPAEEAPSLEKIDVAPTVKDFTAYGTVRDQNSGETLPFATVMVMGTTNGTSTNVDGYFTLFKVPSDTAVLYVQYLGYRSQKFRLLPGMDMQHLDIEMQDMSQQLTEVLVVAEKEEQLLKASTGISTVGLTPAALAKLPSFGEKDVFRSLQLLPGVSGSNESSSGLFVRGGTPDQNLVLFDGFTVYHVDHLFGFFSAFNSNAIKDVQLHKGGFDARFGGRLSSVVELTGKDGNTERFNMGLGLSLLSINAYVEQPFADGKGSILLAGRRSFQSNFYNNLFESFTDANQSDSDQAPAPARFGQQEVQPNSYFYDLNAKLSYRPSAKDLLSISFYNGQDDLDNSRNTNSNAFRGLFGGGANPDFSFERQSTDLTNWGNWGSSLKWSRRWSDRYYSNANLSYSNYFSERDRRNSLNITREDTTIMQSNGAYEYNDLKDVTLKIDNELKLGTSNQLEFGLQSTYNYIDYQYTQNDSIEILNRNDQGWTSSIYLQDKHTFADRLILKGGMRLSHYSLTDQLYTEPRASFTYLLNNRIKLKAAWGQYYQFATRIVREDIQQGSRDFWLLANEENVPISSAEHRIIGFSYDTPNYLFDVEAYHKDMDGLSEYTTRLNTTGFGPNQTLNYEELFFTGTGIAKGLEFLVQKKRGRLTGWVGYTLGEVKYDFDAFGDEPFSANQDQTHELKVVANYKLGSQWTLGATFIYATGRPYTAPTGFYQLELLDGSQADFFEISDKNAFRFPDYHRFDLSATYDFNLGNSRASAGLSIFNLYNRQNVWYREYEVIEGELLETNITLLNLTPSLFFTWDLH
ncbi:MAG: TonB-dependent receptor [Bacteroidota bacterium]